MKFDMKKPCAQCPFARAGAVLEADSARNILGQFADGSGGTFPCHKTAEVGDDGLFDATPESQHCIGALAFAEKQGVSTNFMRVAGRLGVYDPAAAEACADLVYDDMDEALDASRKMYVVKRKRGRK